MVATMKVFAIWFEEINPLIFLEGHGSNLGEF